MANATWTHAHRMAFALNKGNSMFPAFARTRRFAARSASMCAVTLVAACVLLAPVVHAQGFPGGVRDTLGPLYRDNPHAQRAAKRPSKHDTTPRGMVRHWNEV